MTYDIFDAAGTKITGNNTASYTIMAANTWEQVTFNKTVDDSFNQIQYRLKVRSQSNAVMGDIVEFDDVSASFTYATLSTTRFENTVAFTMYPNPTKNMFTIDSKEQIATIEIYNIAGQKVKEVTNTTQVATNDLQSGMYLVRLTNSQGNSAMKKLLKN